MSKWRFGCGVGVECWIPRGMGGRLATLECGSTAPDGGVVQCNECEVRFPVDLPGEEESDMDWLERQQENQTRIVFKVEREADAQHLFDVMRDGVWIAKVWWTPKAGSFRVERGWIAPHETALVLATLSSPRR